MNSVRKGGQSVVLEPYSWRTNQFKYFQNIAGYTGVSDIKKNMTVVSLISFYIVLKVFIGGPYPHWLFMTSRGELRLHPMSIDGAVKCFASFHNVNCSQGFLYINRKVKFYCFLRNDVAIKCDDKIGRIKNLPVTNLVQLRCPLARPQSTAPLHSSLSDIPC